MNEVELIITEDGSHTLTSSRFPSVSYHSIHGSIQETKTVFIDAGLDFVKNLIPNKEINILEMGFGSGLNALMTAIFAKENQLAINYHTIEAYPISIESLDQLNYAKILNLDKEMASWFETMHSASSKTTVSNGSISFTKHIIEIESFEIQKEFDVIYYDAFSPTAQPELWTVEMMQKMNHCLKTGGVLTTYCAKGQFKRNLREAGFKVEGLPGPIGKREMTRARKL